MSEIKKWIYSGEINCSDTIALYTLFKLKSKVKLSRKKIHIFLHIQKRILVLQLFTTLYISCFKFFI
jgi:hypothetical protein